ncbi:hypothetical protein EUGRSUZ_C03436 [Eucalyptus grandis]|uniref:Uncharacterized protein n=2 Tax=Eucalyptus grandis TaxID=71139 RepID=A0ACC3LIJ6_EUCGR|nr:hypothetical protein EUGRSUZ_C03436 [Eucalyptus grandis]
MGFEDKSLSSNQAWIIAQADNELALPMLLLRLDLGKLRPRSSSTPFGFSSACPLKRLAAVVDVPAKLERRWHADHLRSLSLSS